MKYLTTIIIALLLISQNAKSQTISDAKENAIADSLARLLPTLAMQSKTEKNKVVIRWAPANYSLFRHGIENGYTLQRRAFSTNPEIEFNEKTDIDGAYKTVKTVLPWTKINWEQNAKDSTDIYAGLAMQVLLGGELGTDKKGDMQTINAQYEDQLRKFSYALIAADLSKTAALGLGLSYEDTDIKDGYFYEYRLLFSSLPEGFKADTVFAFADMTQLSKEQQVKHCFLEPGHKIMKIVWTRHNDQFFTAYDVERSIDKTNWTKLNKQPFMTSLFTPETPNFYVDSLAANSKQYYYRIIGYTPFGDKGDYSEIMGDKGVDLKAPAPAWGVKAEDMGGYVLVKWDAQPTEVDFDGFFIERSDAPNGHFESISNKLPKDAREFADLSPDPLNPNYYRISSRDLTGNASVSFSDLGYVIDSMAPEKPSGLIGKIDTNGIVSLDWQPGQEADIIGYRVYWSNNKNMEFTQLLADVVPGINYVDSIAIKTLNEEIYYRIVAVDHRYNHSAQSDILTLKKPDLVPPAEPLIFNYQVTDNSVDFKWHPSISKDVIKQQVMRKQEGQEWAVIYNGDNSKNSISDDKIIKDNVYKYKIVATDDANNTSSSEILQVAVVDDGSVKVNIKATFTLTDNVASLIWEGESKKAKFILYKKQNGALQKLASVYNPTNKWEDINHKTGDSYQMRVIFPNGSESQLVPFINK